MDIIITSQSIEPDGTSHLVATAGKISACVTQYRDRWITVCYQNASHRAHRSAGRTFNNWHQATEAYRSAGMRAIIRAARDTFSPRPENVIEFQTV